MSIFSQSEAAKMLERSNIFFKNGSLEEQIAELEYFCLSHSDSTDPLDILFIARKEVWIQEAKDNFHLINLSDTFGWGEADCEKVEDEDLPRVAELFFHYGWGGIVYWVTTKRLYMRDVEFPSEFKDVNRAINFVRHEEEVKEKIPDSNKRAYHSANFKVRG